jgi:hypothetical protein
MWWQQWKKISSHREMKHIKKEPRKTSVADG